MKKIKFKYILKTFMSIAGWWFITRFTLILFYAFPLYYLLHREESTLRYPTDLISFILYILAILIGTAIVIPIFVYRWFFQRRRKQSPNLQHYLVNKK